MDSGQAIIQNEREFWVRRIELAIKLEMLRCFETVVRKGSLADAAAALDRTSSAVSMTLKRFEDHIGAPLFETARKSRLTPLGELVYAEAVRELRHFDDAIEVIEGLSRSKLGYLRMAIAPSIASEFMPKLIREFVKRHPAVQMDIRDMDSEAIASEMRHDRAEIGIGSLPVLGGFDRTLLFKDNYGVLCRASDPIGQSNKPISWSELEGLNFVSNGLCPLIKDEGFQPILNKSRLMVRNHSSLIGVVRSGVGVTVLPELASRNLDDALVFRPIKNTKERREVYMLTRPAMTPATKMMVDLILQARTSMSLAKPANDLGRTGS